MNIVRKSMKLGWRIKAPLVVLVTILLTTFIAVIAQAFQKDSIYAYSPSDMRSELLRGYPDAPQSDVAYFPKVIAKSGANLDENHAVNVAPLIQDNFTDALNRRVALISTENNGAAAAATTISYTGDDLLPEISNMTSVSVGLDHSCGIYDKKAYCWGNPASGALGSGRVQANDFSIIPYPVITSGGGGYSASTPAKNPWVNSETDSQSWAFDDEVELLEAGANYSCASVKTSGQNQWKVYCWGDNTYGQLGLGSSQSASGTQTVEDYYAMVDSLINQGLSPSMALNGSLPTGTSPSGIETDGFYKITIAQYEANKSNILARVEHPAGSGSYVDITFESAYALRTSTQYLSSYPRVLAFQGVATSVRPTKLELGENHACVIFDNGQLHCWGRNMYGEIGSTDPTDSGMNKMVECGLDQNCYAQGLNPTASLADLTNEITLKLYDAAQAKIVYTPRRVTTPSNLDSSLFKDVAVSSLSTCATTNSNNVFCFGSDNSGELGANFRMNEQNESAGKDVSIEADSVANLACKFSATATNMTPEEIRTSCSQYFQTYRYSPVPHKIALRYAPEFSEQSTQSGIPASFVPTKLSASGKHFCVLGTTDSVNRAYCWGENSKSQLGNNQMCYFVDSQSLFISQFCPSPFPIYSASLASTGPTDISTVEDGGCVLLRNVFCWGANGSETLGTGQANMQNLIYKIPTSIPREENSTISSRKNLDGLIPAYLQIDSLKSGFGTVCSSIPFKVAVAKTGTNSTLVPSNQKANPTDAAAYSAKRYYCWGKNDGGKIRSYSNSYSNQYLPTLLEGVNLATTEATLTFSDTIGDGQTEVALPCLPDLSNNRKVILESDAAVDCKTANNTRGGMTYLTHKVVLKNPITKATLATIGQTTTQSPVIAYTAKPVFSGSTGCDGTAAKCQNDHILKPAKFGDSSYSDYVEMSETTIPDVTYEPVKCSTIQAAAEKIACLQSRTEALADFEYNSKGCKEFAVQLINNDCAKEPLTRITTSPFRAFTMWGKANANLPDKNAADIHLDSVYKLYDYPYSNSSAQEYQCSNLSGQSVQDYAYGPAANSGADVGYRSATFDASRDNCHENETNIFQQNSIEKIPGTSSLIKIKGDLTQNSFFSNANAKTSVGRYTYLTLKAQNALGYAYRSYILFASPTHGIDKGSKDFGYFEIGKTYPTTVAKTFDQGYAANGISADNSIHNRSYLTLSGTSLHESFSEYTTTSNNIDIYHYKDSDFDDYGKHFGPGAGGDAILMQAKFPIGPWDPLINLALCFTSGANISSIYACKWEADQPSNYNSDITSTCSNVPDGISVQVANTGNTMPGKHYEPAQIMEIKDNVKGDRKLTISGQVDDNPANNALVGKMMKCDAYFSFLETFAYGTNPGIIATYASALKYTYRVPIVTLPKITPNQSTTVTIGQEVSYSIQTQNKLPGQKFSLCNSTAPSDVLDSALWTQKAMNQTNCSQGSLLFPTGLSLDPDTGKIVGTVEVSSDAPNPSYSYNILSYYYTPNGDLIIGDYQTVTLNINRTPSVVSTKIADGHAGRNYSEQNVAGMRKLIGTGEIASWVLMNSAGNAICAAPETLTGQTGIDTIYENMEIMKGCGLPDGLKLVRNDSGYMGQIIGTPTNQTGGTYTFKVAACLLLSAGTNYDSTKCSSTKSVTIHISTIPDIYLSNSVPMIVGEDYDPIIPSAYGYSPTWSAKYLVDGVETGNSGQDVFPGFALNQSTGEFSLVNPSAGVPEDVCVDIAKKQCELEIVFYLSNDYDGTANTGATTKADPDRSSFNTAPNTVTHIEVTSNLSIPVYKKAKIKLPYQDIWGAANPNCTYRPENAPQGTLPGSCDIIPVVLGKPFSFQLENLGTEIDVNYQIEDKINNFTGAAGPDGYLDNFPIGLTLDRETGIISGVATSQNIVDLPGNAGKVNEAYETTIFSKNITEDYAQNAPNQTFRQETQLRFIVTEQPYFITKYLHALLSSDPNDYVDYITADGDETINYQLDLSAVPSWIHFTTLCSGDTDYDDAIGKVNSVKYEREIRNCYIKVTANKNDILSVTATYNAKVKVYNDSGLANGVEWTFPLFLNPSPASNFTVTPTLLNDELPVLSFAQDKTLRTMYLGQDLSTTSLIKYRFAADGDVFDETNSRYSGKWEIMTENEDASLVGYSFPSGISIDQDRGYLLGAAQTKGNFKFKVCMTNLSTVKSCEDFALLVSEVPQIVSTSDLPTASQGNAYNYELDTAQMIEPNQYSSSLSFTAITGAQLISNAGALVPCQGLDVDSDAYQELYGNSICDNLSKERKTVDPFGEIDVYRDITDFNFSFDVNETVVAASPYNSAFTKKTISIKSSSPNTNCTGSVSQCTFKLIFRVDFQNTTLAPGKTFSKLFVLVIIPEPGIVTKKLNYGFVDGIDGLGSSCLNGQTYSQEIVSIGIANPTLSATNLPPGLTISALPGLSGRAVIAGCPTQRGSFTVPISIESGGITISTTNKVINIYETVKASTMQNLSSYLAINSMLNFKFNENTRVNLGISGDELIKKEFRKSYPYASAPPEGMVICGGITVDYTNQNGVQKYVECMNEGLSKYMDSMNASSVWSSVPYDIDSINCLAMQTSSPLPCSNGGQYYIPCKDNPQSNNAEIMFAECGKYDLIGRPIKEGETNLMMTLQNDILAHREIYSTNPNDFDAVSIYGDPNYDPPIKYTTNASQVLAIKVSRPVSFPNPLVQPPGLEQGTVDEDYTPVSFAVEGGTIWEFNPGFMPFIKYSFIDGTTVGSSHGVGCTDAQTSTQNCAPEGMTIDEETGVFRGAPTTAGNYKFRVQAVGGYEVLFTGTQGDAANSVQVKSVIIELSVVQKVKIAGVRYDADGNGLKDYLVVGSSAPDSASYSPTEVFASTPQVKFPKSILNGAYPTFTGINNIKKVKILVDKNSTLLSSPYPGGQDTCQGNHLFWQFNIASQIPTGLQLDPCTAELSGNVTQEGFFDLIFDAYGPLGKTVTAKYRLIIYTPTNVAIDEATNGACYFGTAVQPSILDQTDCQTKGGNWLTGIDIGGTTDTGQNKNEDSGVYFDDVFELTSAQVNATYNNFIPVYGTGHASWCFAPGFITDSTVNRQFDSTNSNFLPPGLGHRDWLGDAGQSYFDDEVTSEGKTGIRIAGVPSTIGIYKFTIALWTTAETDLPSSTDCGTVSPQLIAQSGGRLVIMRFVIEIYSLPRVTGINTRHFAVAGEEYSLTTTRDTYPQFTFNTPLQKSPVTSPNSSFTADASKLNLEWQFASPTCQQSDYASASISGDFQRECTPEWLNIKSFNDSDQTKPAGFLSGLPAESILPFTVQQQTSATTYREAVVTKLTYNFKAKLRNSFSISAAINSGCVEDASGNVCGWIETPINSLELIKTPHLAQDPKQVATIDTLFVDTSIGKANQIDPLSSAYTYGSKNNKYYIVPDAVSSVPNDGTAISLPTGCILSMITQMCSNQMNLPAGINLKTSGEVLGNSLVPGIYKTKVMVVNDTAGLNYATFANLQIQVHEKPEMTSTALPHTIENSNYDFLIADNLDSQSPTYGIQSSPENPVYLALEPTKMPPGLSLSPDGRLTGRATTSGVYTFMLGIRNDFLCSKSFPTLVNDDCGLNKNTYVSFYRTVKEYTIRVFKDSDLLFDGDDHPKDWVSNLIYSRSQAIGETDENGNILAPKVEFIGQFTAPEYLKISAYPAPTVTPAAGRNPETITYPPVSVQSTECENLGTALVGTSSTFGFPDGLSMRFTGTGESPLIETAAFEGTPTRSGEYQFCVLAEEFHSEADSSSSFPISAKVYGPYTMNILDRPIITTSELPNGLTGKKYGDYFLGVPDDQFPPANKPNNPFFVEATGTPAMRFVVTNRIGVPDASLLPPGLHLDEQTGEIYGTPNRDETVPEVCTTPAPTQQNPNPQEECTVTMLPVDQQKTGLFTFQIRAYNPAYSLPEGSSRGWFAERTYSLTIFEKAQFANSSFAVIASINETVSHKIDAIGQKPLNFKASCWIEEATDSTGQTTPAHWGEFITQTMPPDVHGGNFYAEKVYPAHPCLPAGLYLDADTGIIGGKVTDASLIGNIYRLRIRLTNIATDESVAPIIEGTVEIRPDVKIITQTMPEGHLSGHYQHRIEISGIDPISVREFPAGDTVRDNSSEISPYLMRPCVQGDFARDCEQGEMVIARDEHNRPQIDPDYRAKTGLPEGLILFTHEMYPNSQCDNGDAQNGIWDTNELDSIPPCRGVWIFGNLPEDSQGNIVPLDDEDGKFAYSVNIKALNYFNSPTAGLVEFSDEKEIPLVVSALPYIPKGDDDNGANSQIVANPTDGHPIKEEILVYGRYGNRCEVVTYAVENERNRFTTDRNKAKAKYDEYVNSQSAFFAQSGQTYVAPDFEFDASAAGITPPFWTQSIPEVNVNWASEFWNGPYWAIPGDDDNGAIPVWKQAVMDAIGSQVDCFATAPQGAWTMSKDLDFIQGSAPDGLRIVSELEALRIIDNCDPLEEAAGTCREGNVVQLGQVSGSAGQSLRAATTTHDEFRMKTYLVGYAQNASLTSVTLKAENHEQKSLFLSDLNPFNDSLWYTIRTLDVKIGTKPTIFEPKLVCSEGDSVCEEMKAEQNASQYVQIPNAMQGIAYNGYAFYASGTNPITFSASNLPQGMSMDSKGMLLGTPEVDGEFTISVIATNLYGRDVKNFILTVTPAMNPLSPSDDRIEQDLVFNQNKLPYWQSDRPGLALLASILDNDNSAALPTSTWDPARKLGNLFSPGRLPFWALMFIIILAIVISVLYFYSSHLHKKGIMLQDKYAIINKGVIFINKYAQKFGKEVKL